MDPQKPMQQGQIYRYTLSRDQIQAFVNSLHEAQADMLEELVQREQSRGFPQVQTILDRFQ